MKNKLLFLITGIIFGIMGCLLYSPIYTKDLQYSLDLKSDSIKNLIDSIKISEKENDSLSYIYYDTYLLDSLKFEINRGYKIIDSLKNIKKHETNKYVDSLSISKRIEYIRKRYSRYNNV